MFVQLEEVLTESQSLYTAYSQAIDAASTEYTRMIILEVDSIDPQRKTS